MRAYKRTGKEGFTLVELMIVVAIIGVLAALAIYGVNKYLASSKTAEAKSTVGEITRLATAAYERETYNNEILPDAQSSTTATHNLCDTATKVPATPPPGKKYQPSTADGADFNTGNNTQGWKCLKFEMSQPIYYSYYYEKGGSSVSQGQSGATQNGFEASATGDLNGNGTPSIFARGADIRNGQVVLSTTLYQQNENE